MQASLDDHALTVTDDYLLSNDYLGGLLGGVDSVGSCCRIEKLLLLCCLLQELQLIVAEVLRWRRLFCGQQECPRVALLDPWDRATG